MAAKKKAKAKANPKKKIAPRKKIAAKKPAAKKVAAKKLVSKTPTAPKKVVKAKKVTVVKKPVPAKKKAPAGIPEQLRDLALKVLDERQAEDILTVDLHGKSAMADYAIIASGRSSRQLAAIVDYMRQAFEKMGIKKTHVEGLSQGDWVLMDAGDIIIHLFRPEVRRYYNIEDIWTNGRRGARM